MTTHCPIDASAAPSSPLAPKEKRNIGKTNRTDSRLLADEPCPHARYPSSTLHSTTQSLMQQRSAPEPRARRLRLHWAPVRAGRLVGEANPALRGRRHSCRFPHRNVLCGIGGGGSCHPGLLSPVVNMSLTGTKPVVVHSGESTDKGKPLKSTLGGHPRPRAFFSFSISANLPTCSPCPPRVGSGRDRIRRSLTGGEPIHPAD